MWETEKDTDVQNRLLDPVGEGEGGMFRENSFKTCILSRVKQITSQLGCMSQMFGDGTLGRPRGMGWGRRYWKWIGMGNTCKSMADSCQCMAKTTTIP